MQEEIESISKFSSFWSKIECAGTILPTRVGRKLNVQKYFLHILKFFLHVPEENKICRNISYTCRKKIKCGRIFPTYVGTMLPALSKVQEAFNKSEPFYPISMVTLKKLISYLIWNVFTV